MFCHEKSSQISWFDYPIMKKIMKIENFIENAIHTFINISEREPEPEYNSDRARMKV